MQVLSSKLDHFVDQQLLEFKNDSLYALSKFVPALIQTDIEAEGQIESQKDRQMDART